MVTIIYYNIHCVFLDWISYPTGFHLSSKQTTLLHHSLGIPNLRFHINIYEINKISITIGLRCNVSPRERDRCGNCISMLTK